MLTCAGQPPTLEMVFWGCYQVLRKGGLGDGFRALKGLRSEAFLVQRTVLCCHVLMDGHDYDDLSLYLSLSVGFLRERERRDPRKWIW